MTLAPNRIEIAWQAPLDVKVWGYGTRIDTGGYIFGIFREGRRVMSGSSSDDLERTIARVQRYAAEKEIRAPQVLVKVGRPPS